MQCKTVEKSIEWIRSFQKRNYVFPRFSIDSCSIKTEYLSKLDLSIDLFQSPSHAKLTDFGAWSQQMRRDLNSNSSFDYRQVIDDLIGIKGMMPPEETDWNSYQNFFRITPNRWKSISIEKNYLKHKLADLGSIVDLIAIMPLFENLVPPRVLEIGGGYGRLVEAALANRFEFNEWCLLDVLPSSLALCMDYLESNGYNQEKTSRTKINFWQISNLEDLGDASIDLVINVESFQEMTQEWVNFWTNVINKKTKPGSYFYHSNSFNYKNRFTLDLGKEWTLVQSIDSPRHWTDGHRTEIWQRSVTSL